jgi:hypothetical protein
VEVLTSAKKNYKEFLSDKDETSSRIILPMKHTSSWDMRAGLAGVACPAPPVNSRT